MDTLEKDVELHAGVKLLLSRISSHPEEFKGLTRGLGQDYPMTTNNQWHRVLERYWAILTEQEQNAITDALREANRFNFHAAVMATILEGGREEKEKFAYGEQMDLFGANKLNIPNTILGVATEYTNTTSRGNKP